MLKIKEKRVTFRQFLKNDMSAFICIMLIYLSCVFCVIIILTDDNIILSEIIDVATYLIPIVFILYSLAYGWFLIAQRVLTSGVVCVGKVVCTDYNKHLVLQLYFTISYEYFYNNSVYKHHEIFRVSSKAKNIAITGKEITIMCSKVGGISFIKDVYLGGSN